MKHLWKLIAEILSTPSNILSVVLGCLWNFLVTALYLSAVGILALIPQILTGHTHWILWAVLVLDETVIGIVLLKHFVHLTGLLIGQQAQAVWQMIVEALKALMGRWW